MNRALLFVSPLQLLYTRRIPNRTNLHLEHLECDLQPSPPGRFAKKLG